VPRLAGLVLALRQGHRTPYRPRRARRRPRRVEAPSGFSLFPGDIVRPPRAWLERTANVVRVTEPARGGHFAPFEEPELYAEELRAFFRPYRAAATG